MSEAEERNDAFGIITKDVIMDPMISTTAKAVYCVLAVHRNSETGNCFPSVETMAKGLGLSTRTVRRCLDELEQAHVIRRDKRFREGRQTTNQYVLIDAVARRTKGLILWREG